ncbi:MAG: glycosyltransferase family 2 protein [Candidatus Omnitrophota bacterium]
MLTCDIVIPVWNRLEDTRDCVESIERNTLFPYRLIIIDNASGEKAAAYLRDLAERRHERVLLVKNEKNEGFVKAVNYGISLSKSEFVCILNNDTLVAYGWLGEMVKVIDKNPSIGIVNPTSNTLGQKIGREIAYTSAEKNKARIKKESGLFVDLGSAFGFCMLVRKKVFDEIGLLDQVYGMGNFDDTDFSLRAKKKGYKTVRSFASLVYHKEQRSFNLIKSFGSDFRKNRAIFESRWGATERVIVVMRSINEKSINQLEEILDKHAKEKSWVYVISPRLKTKSFYEKYSNLTFYHFKKPFYISAFLKIIFKKKKPNIIYADDERFLDFMGKFRFFHRATVHNINAFSEK